MRPFLPFLALFAVIGPTLAAHKLQYVPDDEWIPELAEAMEAMKEKYQAYYDYAGPKKGEPVTHAPFKPLATPAPASCSFWMEDIKHQGIAPYAADSGYQVFRNVKDYGAVGDGEHDDTFAIQSAIANQSRCAPGVCNSTSTTPALVYFPPGIYNISTSIVDYYYTQLYGNPNCPPVIRAAAGFKNRVANSTFPYNTNAMIDGDPVYQPNPPTKGSLGYGTTNIFWRSIRNLVIDMTNVPATGAIQGINWPTGQATAITNVVFQMSQASGTKHVGLFFNGGSGGFVADLVFNGGSIGGNFGNQQFTMRNLTFNNVITAINMNYDWGFTFQQLNINNCTTGVAMVGVGTKGLSTGSITILDSTINNTPVFVKGGWNGNNTSPATANSLILFNIALSNVPIAVQNNGQTSLAGSSGSSTIVGWGQGHSYTPSSGPNTFQGSVPGGSSVVSQKLLGSNGQFYTQSKPTFANTPASGFISARTSGAKGNGVADDTKALQKAINNAANQGKILFVDAGVYKVTSTITIPPGSQIVGEALPVILSSGKFFNNINSPVPVVQLGSSDGTSGSVIWSDMIVSTQGQQQGAILIEHNLSATPGTPTALWDVHTRIGGFTGSNLQYANCPAVQTPITPAKVNKKCIAAFMSMYTSPTSSGLYMENCWLWTADHDVDDAQQRQITVYAGRGLDVETNFGPVWLVGTAVEHHTLYQYQFNGATSIFAGFIQTETPYYQPNPSAPTPWPYNSRYTDPQFPNKTITADGKTIPAANAWGLRIVEAQGILIFGAGHYSFFDNYATTCSTPQSNGEYCQSAIVSLEGSPNQDVNIYNLNTVGTHYMLSIDGTLEANYVDNLNVYPETIAYFTDPGQQNS